MLLACVVLGLQICCNGRIRKRGVEMIVKDLGILEGAVLLFGGPYSNLQALQGVLDVASRLEIPADRMICTGDVVAYCGDPATTVDLIRQAGCVVVAGNCEKQLADGGADCGCGFADDTACSLLARGWYAHALGAVSTGARAWMGACPDVVVFTHSGKRYAVIHGGLTDISRFIWSSSDEAVFAAEITALEALLGPIDGVVAGHSGIAFMRDIGGVAWINAGAIGMPPNDGSSQTRYVILDDRADIRRLDYDHVGAKRSMALAGLRQGYDNALGMGYWPSEDVLPLELRR